MINFSNQIIESGVMINFFKKLLSFPFRRITRNANKTTTSAQKNRRHVAISLFIFAIALFAVFIFRFVWLITVNHVG